MGSTFPHMCLEYLHFMYISTIIFCLSLSDIFCMLYLGILFVCLFEILLTFIVIMHRFNVICIFVYCKTLSYSSNKSFTKPQFIVSLVFATANPF